MKYPEYKQLNYAQLAQHILEFWQEHKIFEQSVAQRHQSPAFTFYEGPPSANGTPGIHHVMARTIKDIFCRYKTLQGFQVQRKGGWDTHGLPVELQVEKTLGIKKEDIGVKISIEEYNKQCRQAVMQYTNQWNELTRKIGYWVDLDHPYITYENNYIETLWWLLKQLHDKGLLYKGYTIQPYSPAAGTGLSSHELNYPGTYQDVSDTSITAQFKVKYAEKAAFLFSTPQEDLRILAWTTTPWTLPANCALAIGENIQYVKVKTFNPYTYQAVSVILAKERLSAYFSEKAKDLTLDQYQAGDKLVPYEIEQSFTGKELLEIRYEQLIPFVTNEELEQNAFRVIAGDFVTTEDGTGIVHTASVFGADDFRVAQQNGVPAVMVTDEKGKPVPLVDKQGKFVIEVGQELSKKIEQHHIKVHKSFEADDFYVKNYLAEDEKQENFKSTDEILAIILKLENKAFKVEKYVHSYPHCWRTGKPVLYYPLDSWFIKTTAFKERMAALNKTIQWKPESTGSGRFGNWLENLVDWNLSRSRYWGTPLPIWRTQEGDEEICIGSLEQLREEITKANQVLHKNQPLDLPDLHRPYVDEIVLVSSKGQPMYREPDLIDVWFDSGAMPYAQWHYPFEYQNVFEHAFPADFISEGVDQTRGWFFTLHALATMLFDKVAFKNVISTGLLLDKNGEKMSKSKGNVVDPFQTLDTYGPDATRWYIIENANPWDNLKFDAEGIAEVQRKFFGTLANTYQFFALYANVDGFVVNEKSVIAIQERPELDRWIISKLQTLILETQKAYDEFEPTRAARAIQEFVSDHLSNWYVRLSRKRFWIGKMTPDKESAYQTLYECLMVTAQLMSPIAPFFADWLYKNLSDNIRLEAMVSKTSLAPVSVHLTDWAKAETSLIDKELDERMDLAQRISSLTHALRRKEKIKVRQPLDRILIPVLHAKVKEQVASVEDIIKTEVNIKRIEYVDDTSGILIKSIKPNFKRLGEIYKAKMKEVAAVIQQFKQQDIARLEREGVYEAEISEGFITLTIEDVLIESKDIEGWSVASDQGLTVALDVHISEPLRQEGIARDLVNRLQNLRKDMDLEVQDKIKVAIEQHSESIDQAILTFREYIATEVQALEFEITGQALSEAAELDMDDFVLKVKVEALAK